MPLELVCSKCKEVLYYGRVDYVPTSLSVPTLLRMMSVEQEPRKVYKDEDGYKCSKCHNVLKKEEPRTTLK